MGLNEYDRDRHCVPLQLETDFDLMTGEEVAESSKVILPHESRLFSNKHRVSILVIRDKESAISSETSDANASQSLQSSRELVFDIVLYGGEAYLKPLEVKIPSEQLAGGKSFSILDYSAGWKHSLIAVTVDDDVA